MVWQFIRKSFPEPAPWGEDYGERHHHRFQAWRRAGLARIRNYLPVSGIALISAPRPELSTA